MILSKLVAFLAITAGVSAQGEFGGTENSAAVLAALKKADASTIASGKGAAAYQPNNPALTANLETLNNNLLADWQNVIAVANAATGFYTVSGADAIIAFTIAKLAPDTIAANGIYTLKRPQFVAGGFEDFIAPGLLKLRTAVDAASAAIKARMPNTKLTGASLAFLKIEQSYADVQQFQRTGRFSYP